MEAYGVVSFSVRNIKNEKVAFRLDNISMKEIYNNKFKKTSSFYETNTTSRRLPESDSSPDESPFGVELGPANARVGVLS